MIIIKIKGYTAKLNTTETLPTGQLDFTKVKFIIDETDTVWNDATLTATFSSLMPSGQRKTLPATVNADGEAIVPEKILSTKGAVFTAGLCGSWASGARIATNMVVVCKLLPGAAGDELQDALNNAVVDEEDVYNYIDEKSHIHDAEIDALEVSAESHESRIGVLETEMPNKANLVNGKVPSSELPSYVDDVIEVDDYESLPSEGEEGKIYVTVDNGNIYRWSGSLYIRIADTTEIEQDILALQTAVGTKANKPEEIVDSGASKFTPTEIAAKDPQSLLFNGYPILTTMTVDDKIQLIYLNPSSGNTMRLYTATIKADKSISNAISLANLMTNEQRVKLESIETGANKYVLPPATDSVLGGIKVGANLSVEEDGTLNATGGELTLDELVSVCLTDFIGIDNGILGADSSTALTF